MTNQSVSRRRRLRRRAGVRLALLALPAFFWAAVFSALAGLRLPGTPHGGAADAGPLVLAAAACPLLAALLLGPASLKRGRNFAGGGGTAGVGGREDGGARRGRLAAGGGRGLAAVGPPPPRALAVGKFGRLRAAPPAGAEITPRRFSD